MDGQISTGNSGINELKELLILDSYHSLTH